MTRWATFQADDGGLYYVAETDDGTVVWFGEWGSWDVRFSLGFEHRAFANVFIGQRSGSTVEGRFVDVPKGRTRGSGALRLDFERGASEFRRLSGSFGGTEFRRVTDSESTTAAFTRPEYSGAVTGDLTGVWLCDDGGTYYLRQVDEHLLWFGEHPDASFANVFSGTIELDDGVTVAKGRWFDIHKGEGGASNSGALELRRDPFGEILGFATPMDGAALTRTAQTGGFGGETWRKVDAGALVCTLDKLTITRATESSGDEPYLWLFFVKVDGDTVEIGDIREADVTLDTRYSDAGDLSKDEDLPTGSEISIPSELGRFATQLKTFKGLNPAHPITSNAAVFAIGLIALEADASKSTTVRAAYRAGAQAAANELKRATRRTLRDLIGTAIGSGEISPAELISSLNARLGEINQRIEEAVEGAVKDAIISHLDVGSIFDPDDRIANASAIFTLNQLRTARTVPLSFDLAGDGGLYRVTGRIDFD